MKIPLDTTPSVPSRGYFRYIVNNGKVSVLSHQRSIDFQTKHFFQSIKNACEDWSKSRAIHDERTNQTLQLGFSIKSQLGNPSTLLNAGKTTNFKYEIQGDISYTEVERINSIHSRSKIKDRIEAVHKLGGKFKFIATEQSVFSNNLVLIDSQLPQLLAHIVFEFYSSGYSKVVELVKVIEDRNILGFDDSSGHQFYTYKVKRFLTDVALGMMPSKVWSGKYEATGGYLVVKENGDVLCYHIYNRNEFESYLLNNTKLETASSSRHGFGSVFEERGSLYMNLNLQIRFIK